MCVGLLLLFAKVCIIALRCVAKTLNFSQRAHFFLEPPPVLALGSVARQRRAKARPPVTKAIAGRNAS